MNINCTHKLLKIFMILLSLEILVDKIHQQKNVVSNLIDITNCLF